MWNFMSNQLLLPFAEFIVVEFIACTAAVLSLSILNRKITKIKDAILLLGYFHLLWFASIALRKFNVCNGNFIMEPPIIIASTAIAMKMYSANKYKSKIFRYLYPAAFSFLVIFALKLVPVLGDITCMSP